VPRKIEVEGGWSPGKQRELIARLAFHGSANKACTEMGMHRTGLTKLQNSPGAKSFRDAWDGAVALARRRRAERAAAESVKPRTKLPTIDHRFRHPHPDPLPHAGEGGGAAAEGGGQVLNEYGEWEDEGSFHQRVDEARDSICSKLLRARRLYLMSICKSPGKRAAFEILTELPIDWDRAERLEPQEFEPWVRTNQRQPDMILTAESGWSAGEFGYGPDRKAELRRAIDEHRAEEGLPAINWDEEE
jgi:hypothetical protein